MGLLNKIGGMLGGGSTGDAPKDGTVEHYSLCGIEFRVVWIGGRPWAVAADMAKGLGFRDAEHVTRYVSDKQKSRTILNGTGGASREFVLLSKRGILEVFMAIRKPETEPFRKAVLDLLEAIDDGRIRVSPAAALADRPWSERARLSWQPHQRDVNANFPGCWTVYSASLGLMLLFEDELIRHHFFPTSRDRPDGSIGQHWSNFRHKQGLPRPVNRSLLYVPDLGYHVRPWVYPDSERGAFESWCANVYAPEKSLIYLMGKPDWKRHGELAKASVADNFSRSLSGKPAVLAPVLRKQLTVVGGFAPAGTEAPKLDLAQKSLFG